CLGSWWAYYTLGWGGWWFWDPVENAALMPWLLGTALLHSVLVVERREALKRWTILLAILTFGLSLIGTFLVRSGVLTSVHAFATDPERGVYILLLITLTLGGALLVYAWRSPRLNGGGIFAPISRESALMVNNIGLSSAAVAVLVGTLYPIMLQIIGAAPVSVGPPYFMMSFVPIMTPLLVAVGIGPMLAWKSADLWAAMQRLSVACLGLVIILSLVYGLVDRVPYIAMFGVGLAVWIGLATLTELSERVGLFHLPLRAVGRRLRFLPYSAWGKTLAHMGVAVSILGMAGSVFRHEAILVMHPHQEIAIGPMILQFNQVTEKTQDGYTAEIADFTVWRKSEKISSLSAERRHFPDNAALTNVTAIYSNGISNLYVALGNPSTAEIGAKENKSGQTAATPTSPLPTGQATGGINSPESSSYVVRVYWTPLEPLIWFGAILMALGGVFALLDRTSHERQMRIWAKMGLDNGERRPL
ncbi:MAG: cytochrome c biogenesis protein CcsA, partial [Alphaproteobacteria bacterium]|nr:cytochrome c biogenesis protein CcsA [Alphaproteobacteria bacterium]